MTVREDMRSAFKVQWIKKFVVFFLWMALIQVSNLQAVHSAEVVDRIIAIVNDDIIRLAELNKAFGPIEKQIQSKGYPADKEREIIYDKKMETLNNLIDEKLVDEKINEAGISVKESDIDNTIEKIKSANKYSQEEMELALTSNGMTYNEYRAEVKKQILRNKLVSMEVTSSIIITQSEVQAYYEQHPDKYSVIKRYGIKNILMFYPPEPDSRNMVRSKMEEILTQLKNGVSFDEMAKNYSQAINAADGGKLGFFTINDLSGNIQTAVSPLRAGEFSPVIETEQGFQIFYVDQIVETQSKTLAEASEEIRQTIYEDRVNEKFKTWIAELKKSANIKIMY
jgi:peptidyl-prolyl cis-trans isomerase SurA